MRDLRVERAPSGRGSAEYFVRDRFPDELQLVRSKRGEQAYVIVMVDGDADGVGKRKASLGTACEERDVAPPGSRDHVLICVPTWNIETWLAYLGGEGVDETNKGYPRLSRARDCAPLVNKLVNMCNKGSLREPTPASLVETCVDYQRVFD